MAVDFSKYGLNWKFDPSIGSFVPGSYHSLIDNVTSSKTAAGYTELNTGKEVYTLGAYIGGGTFGRVYEAVRGSDGKAMVVKEIVGASLYNTIKETIINILIVEKTKHMSFPDIKLKGPFAPIIYGVAYNKSKGTCYIFSEKLRATVHSALHSYAGHASFRDVFNTFVIQTAQIMKVLGDELNFNHRDFKTDNCMYIRDAAGAINVRLIDFGFSCITYEGVFMDGGGYHFKYCKLPTRDMAQFLYELYKYKKQYLDASIRKLIETVLTFKLPSGRLCKMTEGCPRMKDWRQSYSFLNTKDFIVPNAAPEVLVKIMKRFIAGTPYEPELVFNASKAVVLPHAVPAVPIPCPPNKVFNPNSGRCVSATGALGRKLIKAAAVRGPGAPAVAALAMKPCPANKPDRNPKTKRCVKTCGPGTKRNATTFKCVKDKAAAAAAPCPSTKPDRNPKTGKCVAACKPGTRRNPSTFRCVKVNVLKRKASVKAKAAVAAKPCPTDKPDRNPKTGRCVKACPPGKHRNGSFKCVK